MQDVEDIGDYLSKHPPVHLMVASYLGVGTAEKKRATPQDLMQFFGAGAHGKP